MPPPPTPVTNTVTLDGMDLLAAVEAESPVAIAPRQRAAIATGIALALPPGIEGQIRPRSGLAREHGITVLNSPGTIDADYRGEVLVILMNFGQQVFRVERGARIAQLVFAPVLRPSMREVPQLDETRRGVAGFGSTGSGRERPSD